METPSSIGLDPTWVLASSPSVCPVLLPWAHRRKWGGGKEGKQCVGVEDALVCTIWHRLAPSDRERVWHFTCIILPNGYLRGLHSSLHLLRGNLSSWQIHVSLTSCWSDITCRYLAEVTKIQYWWISWNTYTDKIYTIWMMVWPTEICWK